MPVTWWEMLTKQATKRTAVTFLALTLGLWGIDFYLKSENYCKILSDGESNGRNLGEKEKGADLKSGKSYGIYCRSSS